MATGGPGRAVPPAPHLRERISALLAGDGAAGARLVGRLERLRELGESQVFAAALHELAHLDLPDDEAEGVLRELADHRALLIGQLGRDPGLAVAAIDYLGNLRGLLRNPTVIEAERFARLERSAEVDELTGLYNRRFFRRSLDRELQRARRNFQRTALLMLDLDTFKPVNDLYGHPFGDKVLRRTAGVIRASVREADLACRFGGEEFAVILPETDRLGAWAVGERVRRHVRDRFRATAIDGRVVALTLSGGVACAPEDATDAATLVEMSDRALYRAKIAGRDRVTSHHAERRRAMRVPVPDAVAAVRLDRGDGRRVEARAVEVSAVGGLFECEVDAWSPDQAIDLRRDGGASVGAGRVVRVEPHGPGRARIAVEFSERIGLWFEPRLAAQSRTGGAGGADS